MKDEPKRWFTVEFWVKPAEDKEFLARRMHHPFGLYESDIHKAQKALEKFLDTRWPAGFTIRTVRKP